MSERPPLGICGVPDQEVALSLSKVVDEIIAFQQERSQLPIESGDASRSAIRRRLAEYRDFSPPRSLSRVTAEVIEMMREWTLHSTHPRYFGLFNPPAVPPSIVADALVALYNPQVGLWSHAPAANEIEQLCLDVFRQRLSFGPETHANFTTGGAEANATAIIAALHAAFPEVATAGLRTLPEVVVYASAMAHHSVEKALKACGLGAAALTRIPVDRRHRIAVPALEDAVFADRSAGRHPLMLIAQAGDTATGVIDDLPGLGHVAQRHGLWYHVDAAWGGAALLSSNRSLLSGIEVCDSVTIDAHKGLGVAMGAGMFFCRDVTAVQNAFSTRPGYLPAGDDDVLDPYQTTMQWSRRFIGLKVFMSLASIGLEGYRALLDHQAAMAQHLRKLLVTRGWILANDTALPLVCFTHEWLRPAGAAALLTRVVTANRDVWVSTVRLPDNRDVLRACITSFETSHADIEYLVGRLSEALERFQWPPADFLS